MASTDAFLGTNSAINNQYTFNEIFNILSQYFNNGRKPTSEEQILIDNCENLKHYNPLRMDYSHFYCACTLCQADEISFDTLEHCVREWLFQGKPDNFFTAPQQVVIDNCVVLQYLIQHDRFLRTVSHKHYTGCHSECPCQEKLHQD